MSLLNLKDLSDEEKASLASLLTRLTPEGDSNGGDSPPKNSPPKKRIRKSPDDTIKYWTEEEWERFIALIANPMYRAMFTVVYHRGLRASETQDLQLSDLRVRDERIQVRRCKGSASGEFHLCASEIRALRAWLKVRGMDPGPLFRTRVGTGISQQMQDRLVKRYAAVAGIPADKRHVHALKHTCGTQLLARGESLEDVQDHLGHRSIKSTERYAKFTSPRRQARDKRLRDW